MTARASLILAGLTLTLAACSTTPATTTTPTEAPPSNTVAASEPSPTAEETTDLPPQNPEVNEDGGYDFGAKVTTPSGIAVQITKVKRGKAPRGDKQGTKKGAPIVSFTFEVTNETKRVWEGAETTVSVVDGETVTEVDEYMGAGGSGGAIGGTLTPGKSKTTTLAYAVPKSVTYLVAEVSILPEAKTILFTGDLK
jgi:hypothetical protein